LTKEQQKAPMINALKASYYPPDKIDEKISSAVEHAW
jgi:hypothetical protein